ncbi:MULTISPECIES: hypothetical protein [unclassified Paenibacillus]|uniref:hypothetical protein n=1 Tax=unclassified Paenibacillus TaxID=185978 RepID=UPI002784F959|nr:MULTISPECIES: hypothetical protein [unclassified Paenibacillus]MDQ0901969.1 hypothetical protein [Paenibacillus sp. V4I7]MDQ0919534.1 hypothetical protein [Paenibacillus sp. V4I5]
MTYLLRWLATRAKNARKQGLEIAMELVDTVHQYFKGIYLITPFMRYEMTAELTRYVKSKDQEGGIAGCQPS